MITQLPETFVVVRRGNGGRVTCFAVDPAKWFADPGAFVIPNLAESVEPKSFQRLGPNPSTIFSSPLKYA